jgi:hypothetical protein
MITVDYIGATLGIDVERTSWSRFENLPYYLTEAYQFESVQLGEIGSLFIRPTDSLGRINDVAKQMRTLSQFVGLPVVLELEQLKKAQRDAFIRHGLAFVVPGRHLYLPFLGVYLQERFDDLKDDRAAEPLTPSEQVVLFTFLYGKNQPLAQSQLVEQLNYSAMSISRACNRLVQKGLLTKETSGVKNVFISSLGSEELFLQAKRFLVNPVRRVVYIDQYDLHDAMFPAGLTALSAVSTLSPPSPKVWGTAENAQDYVNASKQLIDGTNQIALELWKYDPRQLSGTRQIDQLSLVLSLEGNKNERVQTAIQDILKSLWD